MEAKLLSLLDSPFTPVSISLDAVVPSKPIQAMFKAGHGDAFDVNLIETGANEKHVGISLYYQLYPLVATGDVNGLNEDDASMQLQICEALLNFNVDYPQDVAKQAEKVSHFRIFSCTLFDF